MAKCLFSIIVPVYNVEKYLEECVDSILRQSIEDCEVLLVDDGSTDSSPEICDRYAGKYENIRVLHKGNEGLASTWVSVADSLQGRYVGSIDSDDFIDAGLFDELRRAVKVYEPDILVYGYKGVGRGRILRYDIHCREGLYDKEQIKTEILPSLINVGTFENRNCIYLSRINKFIRTELFLKNKISYRTDISYGEDNLWTIPNVVTADSIYVFGDYYPYNYRYNPGSITHRCDGEMWNKFLRLDYYSIEMLKALGRQEMIPQVYRDAVFHAAISINHIMKSLLTGSEKRKAIAEVLDNPLVRKGIPLMNHQGCSRKELLNLYLMENKKVNLCYAAKKIQNIFKRCTG